MKKWIVVCFILGCFCSLQAQPVYSVLFYCTQSLPLTLNPQKASDSNTFQVTRSVYNRLLDFKKGNLSLEPSLAESWKISKDGLTYSFKLRKNVQFHENIFFTPTRHLNADDIVFSFQKMLDAKHAYHTGDYEYFQALGLKSLIKSVEKKDDYIVEFQLSQPNASFLSILAMDFASILSEEYAQKLTQLKKPQHLDEYPIGTGPFYLKSFSKTAETPSLVLHKFEKSWQKNIALNEIQFRLLKDEDARYKGLYSNQCDISESLNYDRVTEFKQKDSPVEVYEKPGLNTSYLAINVQKKPYDNLRFRQALSHALNRPEYIKEVYKNHAVLARNIIPPFVLGHNEQVKSYSYNPNLAKKIVEEDGYKDFLIELWVLPVARVYLQDSQKMAEMIKKDLEAVGLKVKLVLYDWPSYLSRTKSGEHQLALFGWIGDHSDPDNFFSVLMSCAAVEAGSNRSRWCSREFEDLIQEAQRTTDNKKRSDLYRRAQLVARESIPMIPIAHAKLFKFISKRVTGYQIDPLGTENFIGVSVNGSRNKK